MRRRSAAQEELGTPPKPAVEVVVTVHASEAPIVVKTVPKPKPVKAEKRKGEPIYTAKSPVDRLTVPEDFPMTRRSTPQLLEDPVTIAQPSSDGAQRWPAGSARSA